MVAEAFFTEVHEDPFEGPESDEARSPSRSTTRTAWCSASGWRSTSDLASASGIRSRGPGSEMSASGTSSTARGSRPQATRWRTLAPRWRWRLSSSRRSGFPGHRFHVRDVAPEGELFLRVPLRPRRVGRRRRAIPAADGRPVAVGARQTCSPTRAIRAAQPDEPGTPRSSRTRRRKGRKPHARDHPAPGRTKLRAMGRPRGRRPRGRPIARSFVRPGAG